MIDMDLGALDQWITSAPDEEPEDEPHYDCGDCPICGNIE